MVNLTIDGQPVQVQPGTNVLQAARTAGINIPTLCDHPAIKPYGGCRLCVVEVQGARTLLTSCTLPASEGMVVSTDTDQIRKVRRFVLELLFSERNHFCMYCQKSDGDCDLQNAAYAEGLTHWPLQPGWKKFQVDASHPYFVLDQNRCILCRRCERACAELAGNFTLGLQNRGAHTLLIADCDVPMGDSTCIRCGTCVEICPTGALIDRQSAYLAKEAETTQVESICAGCSVGCGIKVISRDNYLIRIASDWEAPVNHGLLCEEGRYRAINGQGKRLNTPLLRDEGGLRPATWEEAMDRIADRMYGLRGGEVAALASTRLPAEALHAFTEIFATGLESPNVTSIEEDLLTSFEECLPEPARLASLAEADCAILVGADLNRSHQVASYFFKRNMPTGLSLIVIDPGDPPLAGLATYHLKPVHGADESVLKGLLAALARMGATEGLEQPVVDLAQTAEAAGLALESIEAVARHLALAQKPFMLLGKGLTRQGPEALKAAAALAAQIGAGVLSLKGKANSLAGHALGLDAPFTPQGARAAYIALGDDIPSQRLLERLENVPFVAVQASYVSELTERADVVLPVETWAEQEGHFVNLEGLLQQAKSALVAPGQVWSNLDVLQSLGSSLGSAPGGDWKESLQRALPYLEEAPARALPVNQG